jgi:hypothetical protein
MGMQTTLTALAVIAVGYVLAYLVFAGGYIIIGFVLGPRVRGLPGAGQVQDLTPIISLALGWLDLLCDGWGRAQCAGVRGSLAGLHLAERPVRVAVPRSVSRWGNFWGRGWQTPLRISGTLTNPQYFGI